MLLDNGTVVPDPGCETLQNKQTFLLAANWENIPETCIINGSIFVVLCIIFVLLTRSVWKEVTFSDDCAYTEQGLMHFLYFYRDPLRWSVLPRLEFAKKSNNQHNHDTEWPNIYLPPNSMNFYESSQNQDTISKYNLPSILSAEQMQATFIARKLNWFFGKFYKVTDQDIIYSKGIDAYEYLLFQRHLILILFVVNIICLPVILPVNWYAGTAQQDKNSFSRTTLKNLYISKTDSSYYYWFHIFSAIIITIVSVFILESFKNSTISKSRTQMSRRTLLLGKIPKEMRNRKSLTKLIKDNFPESHVEAIQFVYDTWDLENEQMKLDCTIIAHDYCLHYKHKYSKEFMVKKTDVNERAVCSGYFRPCSFCLVCCFYWPYESMENGIDYYAAKEAEIRKKIASICEEIVPNATEHAFVTFKSHRQAKLFIDDLAKHKLDGSPEKPNLAASFAPHPDNVEFTDLVIISSTTKARVVLLNLLMIVIFIFVTTPSVLLSLFGRYLSVQPKQNQPFSAISSTILNYISILVQISATAILPNLIVLISKSIPYENSGVKNHSIMWKVFLFLVLMVIIFPSIGMSSIEGLFRKSIKTDCLFPVDNGAYYINYVVSSAFISTGFELIKPGDIVVYSFLLLTSRSVADYEGGRQFMSREFSCNLQYTYVSLIFAVVMTYTISCPLICLFGLIYMIIKHSVDHYNLFYTYFTKKNDKHTLTTAEIFIKVSLLLMQFQTAITIFINTGNSYFALFSQIVFWITLAIFVHNVFFEFTSQAMINMRSNKFHREFCACFYLPRVFSDLMQHNAIPQHLISKN